VPSSAHESAAIVKQKASHSASSKFFPSQQDCRWLGTPARIDQPTSRMRALLLTEPGDHLMRCSPPAFRNHVCVTIAECAPEKHGLLGEPFEHSPFKRLFSISPLRTITVPSLQITPTSRQIMVVSYQSLHHRPCGSPLGYGRTDHRCKAIWNPAKRVQRDIPHRQSPDHGAGITAGVEIRCRSRVAATPWVCGAAPCFL
jgi:hypothetical protein